mgnify:CR=1 FL=1
MNFRPAMGLFKESFRQLKIVGMFKRFYDAPVQRPGLF